MPLAVGCTSHLLPTTQTNDLHYLEAIDFGGEPNVNAGKSKCQVLSLDSQQEVYFVYSLLGGQTHELSASKDQEILNENTMIELSLGI